MERMAGRPQTQLSRRSLQGRCTHCQDREDCAFSGFSERPIRFGVWLFSGSQAEMPGFFFLYAIVRHATTNEAKHLLLDLLTVLPNIAAEQVLIVPVALRHQ